MAALDAVVIFIIIWLAVIVVARLVVLPWLSRGPNEEPLISLLWRLDRLYVRFMFRPTVDGRQHVPDSFAPPPLIVVSNHTGAADPLIIQAQCPFHIRWMMARDMMTPTLDWVWNVADLIPVARNGADSGPLREAIRHVKSGGVIGIFPEGRIVWPPKHVWPFLSGVGMLVKATRAPVLLTWIRDTPPTTSMGEALTSRCRSRVTFIELIEYDDPRDAAAIAADLRQRLAEASGWPMQDDLPPMPTFDRDPFNP